MILLTARMDDPDLPLADTRDRFILRLRINGELSLCALMRDCSIEIYNDEFYIRAPYQFYAERTEVFHLYNAITRALSGEFGLGKFWVTFGDNPFHKAVRGPDPAIAREARLAEDAAEEARLAERRASRRPVPYAEYIRSDAWRAKALRAKEAAGWRCQVCNVQGNQTTLNAHHRTYERLGNELDEDITVLCRTCHELFSKNGKLAK